MSVTDDSYAIAAKFGPTPQLNSEQNDGNKGKYHPDFFFQRNG
jgi:hypothetical protein